MTLLWIESAELLERFIVAEALFTDHAEPENGDSARNGTSNFV